MLKKTIAALAVLLAFGTGVAQAAGAAFPPPQPWSWTGFFGEFDQNSLQRGFQVYTEVCSACHSLKHIRYRDLTALGYTEAQIKAFAARSEVTDGPNDEGEMFQRPAALMDPFVAPFANEKAAAFANNGALPPDLSLIVKARALGQGNIGTNFLQSMSGRGAASGADYVYALLTGYIDDVPAAKAASVLPTEFEAQDGKAVNRWFPGHNISMAPPLADDAVTYADGTKATTQQMAHDVASFLAWASEPGLEQRKQTGFKVLLFLAIFLVVAVVAKRRLWATLH